MTKLREASYKACIPDILNKLTSYSSFALPFSDLSLLTTEKQKTKTKKQKKKTTKKTTTNYCRCYSDKLNNRVFCL